MYNPHVGFLPLLPQTIPDETLLQRLTDLVTESLTQNSSKFKETVIAKYHDLKFFFPYIFDTLRFKYYITQSNILKNESKYPSGYLGENYTLIELLTRLDARSLSGHDACFAILYYISRYPNYRQLILNIIDRDLKNRIGSTMINKVFPQLISLFNVSLAEDYDGDEKPIDFARERWYFSRKMDGLRTVISYHPDSGCYITSRGGENMDTLSVLKTIVTPDIRIPFVLDGEGCIIDKNGLEDFQAIMKLYRRKDFVIPDPQFRCFDLIDYNGFYNEHSQCCFEERMGLKLKFFEQYPNTRFQCIPQILVESQDHFEKLREDAHIRGWEGGILRRGESEYYSDRNDDMRKAKYFLEKEFTVVGVVMENLQYIDRKPDGSTFNASAMMLSSVDIEYKGFKVNVGSGFSLDERMRFYQDPTQIIGKEITVKYFQPSRNQNGGESLRHPIVKTIWEGKRNV